MGHLSGLKEEREYFQIEYRHYEDKVESIQMEMLKKAEKEERAASQQDKEKKGIASKISAKLGFKKKDKDNSDVFPLGQPNFISDDKPAVDKEEIIDDWDVLECPEEARKKGKLERSIEKFHKARNAWDEFCERSHLIIQSITILVDELKVDLTIGFTAHIQLQHYAALDKAFSNCGLDFDSEEEPQQTQLALNVQDDQQEVATMFETF